jgi:hypothetical protein
MCPYDCNFAKEAKADASKTGEDKSQTEKKYICDDPYINSPSNQYKTFQWDKDNSKVKENPDIDTDNCKKFTESTNVFMELQEKIKS